MLQLLCTSCLIVVALNAPATASAASCIEKDWIDARAALLIATKLADLPKEWAGVQVRARIYQGYYAVSFFPVPSVPDSFTTVRLDRCGNVLPRRASDR